MARIVNSRLRHFDPMARSGEQVIAGGGPDYAKMGLFGGNMDIDELNKLNRAIASGMDIAKDVVPTIKGVVDAPMKKIQEMSQQSDIKKARAAAAKQRLKDEALPVSEQEVVEQSETEEVYNPSAQIPMSAQGFPDDRSRLPRRAGSARGLRLDPGAQMLDTPSLAVSPDLTPLAMKGMGDKPLLPVSTQQNALKNLVRLDPLNRMEGYQKSGLPSLPNPTAQLAEPNLLQQAAQAQMRAMQRPVQPARPAAPMPSATGARVMPLQASTSGAPVRSAPAPAGQRTMRPPAQATPAAPANERLLADPSNRAFVRTVLKEMKDRGQEPDMQYAMDLLQLEVAKRGTPATAIVDEQVREVLKMEPTQAASTMDTMGLYALADQSTVADWPKIEPIARQVIQKQPRGFLDLINMDEELEKVYKRLGKKKAGTAGVEFDLKGIAERGLKGAQAAKARGRKRGKGGISPRKSLQKYLDVRDARRLVGDQMMQVSIHETNEEFEKLNDRIGTKRERRGDKDLRKRILRERQRLNNKYKISDVKSVDPKTAGRVRGADLRGALKQAEVELAENQDLVNKLEAELNSITVPTQPEEETRAQRNKRIKAEKKKDDVLKELKGARKALSTSKSKHAGAKEEFEAFDQVVVN